MRRLVILKNNINLDIPTLNCYLTYKSELI